MGLTNIEADVQYPGQTVASPDFIMTDVVCADDKFVRLPQCQFVSSVSMTCPPNQGAVTLQCAKCNKADMVQRLRTFADTAYPKGDAIPDLSVVNRTFEAFKAALARDCFQWTCHTAIKPHPYWCGVSNQTVILNNCKCKKARNREKESISTKKYFSRVILFY